ncbi:antibiotic biosynthesis monooxygenase [Actinoplanes sp. NPDC051470]|uniref:putative quinol monooxygenase n=1 Tax=unclassified Actinoplanes TaxID=2626549 RepID=UPI003426EE15
MVSTEVAFFDVHEDRADEFIEVFTGKAVPLLHKSGATDVVIYQNQRKPGGFVFICGWPTPTARTDEFEKSEHYPEFISVLGEFVSSPPTIGDFRTVHVDR